MRAAQTGAKRINKRGDVKSAPRPPSLRFGAPRPLRIKVFQGEAAT